MTTTEGGTIAERLRARLAALEIGPAVLRRSLADRGVSVSRQTVYAWTVGRAHPTPGHLLAILDVLLISSPRARGEWLAALALPAEGQ